MRAKASPEEIEAVITALQRLWLRVPEQRLGQLLLNLARHASGTVDATRLWNMDESDLLEAARKWPERSHDPKTCTSRACDYRSCK